MHEEEVENLKLTLERLVSESPIKETLLRKATILKDTRVSDFGLMKQIDSASETQEDWSKNIIIFIEKILKIC